MSHQVTVLPENKTIAATHGDTLLCVLRSAKVILDAPCGGNGKCGKCRVIVDDTPVLACHTVVDRDMTVILSQQSSLNILSDGISPSHATTCEGYCLAFDIGTTTVVGYLMHSGKALVCDSRNNPQSSFGADVISRIRLAVQGQQSLLTDCIQDCMERMSLSMCHRSDISPEKIETICVVGNPAMQQLFLGISVENLSKVPFSPLLTQAKTLPAKDILPSLPNASMLIVPNIAGFVGADTVACLLAIEPVLDRSPTLLVDIGTNAEMVLSANGKQIACSAAAGPALEGAGIRFGMRGQEGAIDHVWLENGHIRCSVIGGGTAVGICGSGLVDAVAAALDCSLLNQRGKILTDDGLIHLQDGIFLTQEDIRQIQLAKGAIAACIRLMANHAGICLSDFHKVYLAGAFGTHIKPRSACRIGLIPKELEKHITPAGNAAGSGAELLASNKDALEKAQRIVSTTEALEFSTLPQFPRCFAQNMRF